MKSLFFFILFSTVACSLPSKGPTTPIKIDPIESPLPANLDACFGKVYNRGRPPASFMNELIAWGKDADAEIFAVNNKQDIYSLVKPQLGPWKSDKHRRAAMLEVLRVLGGFESSWDWTEGRDMSANNTSACTMEAGIFQTSGNSKYFGGDLKTLMDSSCGSQSCERFIKCTKESNKKPFAIEYTARLLRHTTRHHGPLIRAGDVRRWLNRDCMKAIEGNL